MKAFPFRDQARDPSTVPGKFGQGDQIEGLIAAEAGVGVNFPKVAQLTLGTAEIGDLVALLLLSADHIVPGVDGNLLAAEPVDAERHYIAGFQEYRRGLAQADSGGGAGGDQVTGLERVEL